MLEWIAFLFDVAQVLAYPAVWAVKKVNEPFNLPDVMEFEDDPNNTFRID